MISFSKKSSTAAMLAAACLVSGSIRFAVADTEADAKYVALHKALIESSGFPEDAKAACMKTDFVTAKSWSLGEACDASKPSADTTYADLDCTPACVAYFVDNGPECELGEDAGKLGLAKAWAKAEEGEPVPNADKKALYAWFAFTNEVTYENDAVEGLNADKIVQYLKDNKGDGGAVDEFLGKMDKTAIARFESGEKEDFISKCVKDAVTDSPATDSPATDSPATDSPAANLPSTSAVTQGALISGVIGTVAYAFM